MGGEDGGENAGTRPWAAELNWHGIPTAFARKGGSSLASPPPRTLGGSDHRGSCAPRQKPRRRSSMEGVEYLATSHQL